MTVQAGLCQSWSETPKIVFLRRGSNICHEQINTSFTDKSETIQIMELIHELLKIVLKIITSINARTGSACINLFDNYLDCLHISFYLLMAATLP